MRITRLGLRQFRNYPILELTLSPYKNLFIGQNGQGKTNLLEAVYILSHTYSNRTNKERELMQHGQDFATLSADVVSNTHGAEHHLNVHYAIDPQNHRLKTVFKANGFPLKSRSQFLGLLPTVSFFVSDLLLLRGAPEDRRHWLDAAVTQYDKRHLYELAQYQKIKTQKSKLLKEPLETISREHLDVWNDQLAVASARVTAGRLAYLSRIREQTLLTYFDLSGGEETLDLAYKSRVLEQLDVPAGDNAFVPDALSLEQGYRMLLDKRREDEIRRGTCLVGPHRDDIHFALGGKDAASFGSQGQQRTVVLALKLTELWLLVQKIGEQPVLLLDDVMAELDLSRQRYLIDRLDPGIQVLMTTTHVDQAWHQLFAQSGECIFEVQAGQVGVRSENPPLEGSLTERKQ